MKTNQIRDFIKKECKELGFAPSWFYSVHLLAVEKYVNFLLNKLPKANKEVVMLGVWLHDSQRIRGIKGSHQKIGAREAGKILENFNYSKETIEKVKNIILTHSGETIKPTSLEGRILSSADAMAHYVNDFYLHIAVSGDRDIRTFKEWALEKLDRDYNTKISFSFAKKEVKERHLALKKVFTMK